MLISKFTDSCCFFSGSHVVRARVSVCVSLSLCVLHCLYFNQLILLSVNLPFNSFIKKFIVMFAAREQTIQTSFIENVCDIYPGSIDDGQKFGINTNGSTLSKTIPNGDRLHTPTD